MNYTKCRRFALDDWSGIREAWTAWWHQDLDRAMVVMDLTEAERIKFIPHFKGWEGGRGQFPVEEVLDHYQGWFEKTPCYGDTFPQWWPNFGAGILAAFLGAEVSVDTNTVWFEPPADYDWGRLSQPQAEENFWWRWVTELARSAVEKWEERISVGQPDLGGNLDILASLWGTEDLLLDLSLQPELVKERAAQTTRRWLEAYNSLDQIISRKGSGTSCWPPMWCPGRYYMLQSDLSYMISPQMFEEFVLDDLQQICSQLDFGFYHLDGKGQLNHLDILLSIPDLHGIQWVPGDGAPPPEEWLDVLGRIRQAGKLCQVYVTPAGALKIARELGPRGFTFMIFPPPAEEQIPGLLRELEGLA